MNHWAIKRTEIINKWITLSCRFFWKAVHCVLGLLFIFLYLIDLFCFTAVTIENYYCYSICNCLQWFWLYTCWHVVGGDCVRISPTYNTWLIILMVILAQILLCNFFATPAFLMLWWTRCADELMDEISRLATLFIRQVLFDGLHVKISYSLHMTCLVWWIKYKGELLCSFYRCVR